MVRAALYTAALLAASPAAALDADARAVVEAARHGEMTRLVVRDAPKGPYATPIQGPDGAAVTLADFAGKVVFVNFWATWCAPCLVEMPHIDAMAAALQGEDFAVVTVATDRGADRPRAWLADPENGIETLDFYYEGSGALAREVGVTGLPLTIMLDRQGREVARFLGDADWSGDAAARVIGALIDVTAPGGA